MYVETKAFKTLTIDHDVYIKNANLINKEIANFPKYAEMTPLANFNRQTEARVVWIFSDRVQDNDLKALANKIIDGILDFDDSNLTVA